VLDNWIICYSPDNKVVSVKSERLDNLDDGILLYNNSFDLHKVIVTCSRPRL